MPQMFPDDSGFVVIPPDDVTQSAQIANTLAFDYTTNRLVIADGSPVLRSEAAAVRQWVELMLRTYLGRFRVYTGYQFGHTGEDLIGMRQVPSGFIHSEMAREIREACGLCPAIEKASDFTFSRENRTLHVKFLVTLKTGEQVEVTGNVG